MGGRSAFWSGRLGKWVNLFVRDLDIQILECAILSLNLRSGSSMRRFFHVRHRISFLRKGMLA